MASPFAGFEVEKALRPEPEAFAFDLDQSLSSVLVLQSQVDGAAYTANTLGTERLGNAIVISDRGLVLTIGYLITEAEGVVLTTNEGRHVPAHVLGVDGATGFGLLQALEPLDLPALPIGDSRRLQPDEALISVGGGGRAHALSSQVSARIPFAGYWEYYLDDALFVGPGHPHWSGAALINQAGELVGVGSLQLQGEDEQGRIEPLNMFVPTELLPPILDDLAKGRAVSAPRPWLGVLAQDVEDYVVVLDVSPNSPAARAELKRGDVLRAVAGRPISNLGDFYKRLWALGDPGVVAPLTLVRGGDVFDVDIRTGDRALLLKKRRLH